MYRKIAEHHGNACLMIVKKEKQNDEMVVTFICSGFLCHSNGYILTCAHGINLTDELAIIPPQPINSFNKLTQEKVQVIDVQISQYDNVNDVALLKITTPPVIRLSNNILSTHDSYNVGSSVCYLGFPFAGNGLHPVKFSQSIISSKLVNENNTKQYQLDSMVHEGNSGGPLIDVQTNQIIGIINGKYSPTGNNAVIKIGNQALGQDSSISFATSIIYGIELMKSEGLDV